MAKTDNTQVILDIAIALSAQKDRRALLSMIIEKSMNLTSSDAGTLYMYEDGVLKFSIMKTLSMGVDKGVNEEITDIPPVQMHEENICAYCAMHKEALNIENVYNSDRFDFSGPKKYDALTGYHTQSMMTIPLVDSEDALVGVLQLLNAQDSEGQVRAYTHEEEELVLALASQTAIVLSNMRYQEELKEQMWSFTEAMAEAIDARTPYNASHTRSVARYCGIIVDHINTLHEKGETEDYFDKNRKEQLIMGALLHDIGKMVTPLEVMNKESRLGGREKDIIVRLEGFKLRAKIALLEGRASDNEYTDLCERCDEAVTMIGDVNCVGFLPPEKLESVEKILSYEFVEKGVDSRALVSEGADENGLIVNAFFTDAEKECLRIVKGTLTAGERKIIENHVVMTRRILEKVHFNSYFADSSKWASQHHECLNGRGYPDGLKASDLALDARIIAVADICDALLATDRPYKKALPKEKAFAIMRDMAANGNIDGRIVEYLYDCLK